MLGGFEVILILGAIIFLFGGKKFVDWIQKVKQAKKDLKEDSKKD